MKRTAPITALILLVIASAPPRASAQSEAPPNETPPQKPELTKPPKLLRFVEAPYPESEKAAGRTASVILQIAIDDKGLVEDVAVVQSAGPAFDAAAIAAAKQFVFEPAEIDHKPAPVRLTYRYDFVLKEAPRGPVVNFAGTIENSETKKPIAGATVTLEDGSEAETDERGHFEFEEVPSGRHKVTISGEGFTTVSTEETIEKNKKLDVKYSVEPTDAEDADEGVDMEVVITAPKIKKEVVTTEIKAEEGKRVPGTQGDTLKVVQNLPGVARAAFGSGQLVVWGASPQDTRVYVDGVPIPLLFHGGGLRSTINSDMVRAIELSPGGYGSEYGGGIGGLVTVDTRAPRADRVHGYVAADVIDGSTMIEAPIGTRTRIAIAGRQSYLDRDLKLVTSDDVADLVPIPTYYDGQIKIVHDLRDNESIELFGLISHDRLVRTVVDPDPAQNKSEETIDGFSRVMLKYRYQLADGQSIFLTPYVGRDEHRATSRSGGSPTDLEIRSLSYGIRAGWRGKIETFAVASAGLDFEASFSDITRVGAVILPAREGDIHVFGQPPPDQVNADDWSTHLARIAPYAQIDVSAFDGKLHVIPGARLEPYLMSGTRLTPLDVVPGGLARPDVGFTRQTLEIEPRFAFRYQMSERLSFKAALGRYHQLPQPEDLSAIFGNPTLGPSSSWQYLAGGTFRFTDALSAEVVGFYTKSTDLVSRSASPTPLLAQALVQEAEGRAYGGQILVRQELARGFFGWASYSLIRSERKDHPDSSFRLFDFDQTHIATVVASYDLGAGWELGGRFRYATGFPRTPVIGAFYDGRRDLFEPFFGAQNSIRIPAFLQLDARIAKRFSFDSWKAEMYLDVQNVTNRSNPEDIVYSYNYQERKYITGLPLLPVFGARIEW